jgi:hypothetical protein
MKDQTTTPKGGKTKTEAKAPLVGMDAFKTRDRANAGQRVELYTPEGNLSKHFLVVQGIDSDSFQRAKAKQARVIAELVAEKDEAKRDELLLDATCDLLAVLVKDWSFSDPALMPAGQAMECTVANVSQFLRDAPQIREKVDELASRRTVFFRMQSAALKSSPEDSLT